MIVPVGLSFFGRLRGMVIFSVVGAREIVGGSRMGGSNWPAESSWDGGSNCDGGSNVGDEVGFG